MIKVKWVYRRYKNDPETTLRMKTIMCEVKNIPDGIMANNTWQKKQISEIEDTTIKTIQNETQKKKIEGEKKKKQTRLT